MLVTAREAAWLLDIPVGTVRSWVERGLLVKRGHAIAPGRPNVYRWGDVVRAEQRARAADPTARRSRALALSAAREAGSLSSWL